MSPFARLDAFPLIRTRNLDELRLAFNRIYPDAVIHLVGLGRTLQTVINHLSLSNIGLSYAKYGADIRFEFPESDMAAQIFALVGKGEGSIDRTFISTDPKRSMVVSSGNAIKFSTSADYERFALTIKSAALKSKLEAITGNCIGAPLKFEIKEKHPDFATKALRRHCLFLVEAMGTSPSIPGPVLSQLEQTIIVMFLHANRHNYSRLLEEGQPAAASWQVRRAEEYLEANCAEMPNLEAIAAETNVSILSLVRGFRRNRGCSPSEFVRQVRSGRADKAATNSAVTATVTNLSDNPGCPRCGAGMKLIQTLPKTTVLPRLRSYQCLPCRELVTQLVRDR